MASDLSSYKVATNEKPASSSKFDNFVQKVQDTLNAIGDTSLMTFTSGTFLDASAIKQGTATTGQVLSWNGSAWAAATSADVYYRKVTERDVSTTIEQDLLNSEISIAANALSANGTVRMCVGGDFLNSTGSDQTLRLKLKLGSQTAWDSGVSGNIATSGNRRAWQFDAVIQAVAATNVQRASGFFTYSDNNSAATGTGAMSAPGVIFPFLSAATSVDMTTGQALALTTTLSSGACSMRLKHASVQVTA